MPDPTIEQWKAQAAALRQQADALAIVQPAMAANLRSQADGIDAAIRNAGAVVGEKTRAQLLGDAAAVLNEAAWAAIMNAQTAVSDAGNLSLSDKVAIAQRISNPLMRFFAASPAEEKVARLLGARSALRRAYELLGQKWRANLEFRSALSSEVPGASSDLERAWASLVEWEGRVNDALHVVRDAPLSVADSMMSAYFSALVGQLDKASNTFDSILEALRKLAEALKRAAGAAADAPGWLIALGIAVVGGGFVLSRLK